MNDYPLFVSYNIEIVVTGHVVELAIDSSIPVQLAERIKAVAQDYFNKEE